MPRHRQGQLHHFTPGRGAPFRRPLRYLYVVSPLLTVAAVLFAMVWQREAIYSRGPLSPGHAILADNCKQCHSTPFRRVRLSGAGAMTIASNKDCLHCHQRTIGHSATTYTATHHERVPSDGRSCATCHLEHAGRALVQVADPVCLSCHADLHTVQREVDVAAKITTFAAPPAAPSSGQALHPEFRWLAEKKPDPGVLSFNHQRHLLNDKLLGPDGKLVALQCQDCHRPTGDTGQGRFGRQRPSTPAARLESLPGGSYMAPIAYATHCAACHPLTLPEQPGALRGDDAVTRDEVPHTTPAAIRTYLRGQLVTTLRATDSLPSAIVAIETKLYRENGQGCRKCHALTQDSLSPAALPTVVPTALGTRFLPRARFNHAKHRAAALGGYADPLVPDCLACHGRAVESTRTSDVLIPGIDDCRRCHAPPSGRDVSARGGAPAHCTTCHSYHVPPPAANGPTPVTEGSGPHSLLPSLIAAGRRETLEGMRRSTPIWPLRAFYELPAKIWGLPEVRPGSARFDHELFARYGLVAPDFANDGLPLGMLKSARPKNGEPGLTVTCDLCHSAALFGHIVIGQPNPFVNMRQLWIDLGIVGDVRGEEPLYDMSPVDNTVVNAADQLGLLGLILRNPDLSTNVALGLRISAKAAFELKPEFDAMAHLKTPPWYTYAIRKSGACGLYADGGQPKSGNFAAFTYMATFLDIDGQELAAALQAWKRSGPAFLSSLTPPRYPFAIRRELIPRGLRLYNEYCARCHGSYAAGNPTPELIAYPGLVYPVDEIKTDPKRAHFPQSFATRTRTVLKEEYTLTGGYAAPPLTAIWARSPYLHNGSVPTLRELLDPPSRRARYLLSADPNNPADFDQRRVGWRVETEAVDGEGPQRVYDPARGEGLSNAGHLYGANFDADQRDAVIEFLKSL